MLNIIENIGYLNYGLLCYHFFFSLLYSKIVRAYKKVNKVVKKAKKKYSQRKK